jgi:hypothetical protein
VTELYRPEVEYLGKRIEDVLPEISAIRFVNTLESVFATGEVQSKDYSLTFKQTIGYYEARLVRSTDDEALAIVRNVTHQKVPSGRRQRRSPRVEHSITYFA